jgi:hypothetical protein
VESDPAPVRDRERQRDRIFGKKGKTWQENMAGIGKKRPEYRRKPGIFIAAIADFRALFPPDCLHYLCLHLPVVHTPSLPQNAAPVARKCASICSGFWKIRREKTLQ